MNGETARGIIRAQDEAARARLQAMVKREARTAKALAEALRPFRGGAATTFTGRVRPEALRAVRDTVAWARGNGGVRTENLHCMFDVSGERYGSLGLFSEMIEYAPDDGQLFVSRGAANAVDDLYLFVKQVAENCDKARVVPPVLVIPDDVHPPRHGLRLRKGTLARLVLEDLDGHLDTGRRLEHRLVAGDASATEVESWRQDVLDSHEIPYGPAFIDLTRGLRSCVSPVVEDPTALSRAYLALALAYLEEVRERMPDYAEASGQTPKVSMNISGNTIYGGQFAAQIANIDSTIAGVVRQGGHDVAQALEALEQAVLSQRGVSEDERRDLLDNVAYLATAAETPPAQRNRGIIRSVLAALSVAATTGDALHTAMESWSGVLQGLIP